MGGIGSGRCGSHRKAENCLSLDVAHLRRANYLTEGYSGTFTWRQNGSLLGAIDLRFDGMALELFFCVSSHDVEQQVLLEHVPCTKGGSRPYFLCNGHPNGEPCGRRVGKLFLARRRFLCRHCQGIVYTSQSETRQDRLYRKANKMRRALAGELGLFSAFPSRPKGMHRKSYLRRTEKLKAIETEAYGLLKPNTIQLISQMRGR